MKKIFLMIAVTFSVALFAQTEKKSKKTDVPAAVKEGFTKDFPGKKAKWGAEDGGYEAEFKLNGSDASAVYDKKGHKKELELDIKTTELPASAIAYIKKNYPTSKITEAANITDDNGVITYEAEIGKDGKSYDVLFDTNGKFIKIVEGD